jgi:hypothetical protein
MERDVSVTASIIDKQEFDRVLPTPGGSSMWHEVATQIEKYELFKQSRVEPDSKEAVLRCLGHLEKEATLLSGIFRLVNIRYRKEQRTNYLKVFLLFLDLADFGVPAREITRLRQKFRRYVKQQLIQSYSAGTLFNLPKFEMPRLSPGEHAKREPFIVYVISIVDDRAREKNAGLNSKGMPNLLLEYLLVLATNRGSLPVTSLERLPGRTKTDFDDSYISYDLVLAESLLKRLRDKDALKLKEIEELKPPLTYNEILSYYLRECSPTKEELSFLADWYPAKRYCPECGEIFSQSKGHPSQLFCSRPCSNRARQRRHRKRAKGVSPVLSMT